MLDGWNNDHAMLLAFEEGEGEITNYLKFTTTLMIRWTLDSYIEFTTLASVTDSGGTYM